MVIFVDASLGDYRTRPVWPRLATSGEFYWILEVISGERLERSFSPDDRNREREKVGEDWFCVSELVV